MEKWADDLCDVISRKFYGRRIVIDRLDADARAALEVRQISVSFSQDVIERNRG
jgi:hypothetical protein